MDAHIQTAEVRPLEREQVHYFVFVHKEEAEKKAKDINATLIHDQSGIWYVFPVIPTRTIGSMTEE